MYRLDQRHATVDRKGSAGPLGALVVSALRLGFGPLRVICVLVLVVALTSLSGAYARPARAAGGVPVLLDFDNLPVGTPVHSFPGLTLVNFGSTNIDGTPHFTIVQPSVGTVSGTQTLQSHFDSQQEFSGTHMTMSFNIPQSRVSLSTGLGTVDGGPFGGTLLLQGFDRDPVTPGATPIAQAVGLCPGTLPSITNPLELSDGGSRIRFAVLSLVSCDRPTDPSSGAVNSFLFVDNLSYERELNPAPHENDPPIITIIDPQRGATVSGGAPGEIAYNVRATVQEADLDRITATVNGQPAGLVSFFAGGPNTYNASVFLTDKEGLVVGNNTIVLTARDYDNPPQTGSASVSFNFQPTAPPLPTQVDFWPTAFEVSQAIDTGPHLLGDVYSTLRGYEVFLRSLFDVPLLKGRLTLIRVFGAASGTQSTTFNVPAVMDVSLDHCNTNCSVARGLPPMGGWIGPGSPAPNLGGITVAPFGTPGASDVPSAARNLSSTWNFVLMPNWTQQDLVVTISINNGDYQGFPQQPARPECSVGVAGQCFNNNQVKLHLGFDQPNDLVVNPVFVHVTGSYKGQTYDNVRPSDAQFDTIIQGLNELYPIHVVAGARKDITVGPDISKEDLLDRIDDASGLQPCFAVASGPNVWLGLFPSDQSKGPGFAANDSVLGLANVGSGPCAVPAAWANANSMTIAAHEIGHLIGFDHWGCEHQGNEECKAFPIPHGGIGGIGIDVANFRVSQLDTSSAPFHSHDFMVTTVDDRSTWVSWYTYQILMTHSAFGTYDADDPPAFLVRGRISANGTATLSPVYRIDVPQPIRDTAVEDGSEQILTLRGYDGRGNTILVHSFEPQRRDQHGTGRSQEFEFTEAIPAIPGVERLGLFAGPRQLGELRSATAAPAGVSIQSPGVGARWPRGKGQTIRWTTPRPDPHLAALVEFSPDGGKTRILLGRDIHATSLTVKADELPGSDNAMIFVQLSDGLHTAEASSPPFSVASKPPTVHIMTPRKGSEAAAGMPISLSGRAFDRQETLDESRLRWTSDRDGVLGIGSNVTVPHLSPGYHVITWTVTDSHGLSAKDTVTLRVRRVGSEVGDDSHLSAGIALGIGGTVGIVILGLVALAGIRRTRRRRPRG